MARQIFLTMTVLTILVAPVRVQAQTAADADFDGNGRVGFSDFLEFAQAFGSSQAKYDLNGNGTVDFPDFLAFVMLYGQTVAPGGETPAPGKVVATIPLEHDCFSRGLIAPDGRFLYVIGCRDNVVSVIDIPSHEVVKTIAVGTAFQDTEDLACYMAATPDNKYVYVNYNQTDDLSVIETSSHQIIKVIAVGTSPWKISLTPDGKYAYVPNIDDESISVINTSSNEVVRTIVLPERQQPLEIVITPNGKYGYVIGYDNWIISVVDLSSEYEWAWYGRLVGAFFDKHPKIQPAVLHIVDSEHISTRHLPPPWKREDEWYNFRTPLSSSVKVLITVDETTYSGGKMGANHPISWCQEFDGGRAWYTAMGHTEASYCDPLFLAHILGGIRWAAGLSGP